MFSAATTRENHKGPVTESNLTERGEKIAAAAAAGVKTEVGLGRKF